MLFTFLSHQWTSFLRSSGKGSSIAIQIFLGLLVLWILASATFIGMALEDLLPRLVPAVDPIVTFNGLILYYFAVDFLMRLQLQELPTLSIVPYLHLNIRKNKLVSFLNIRALFNAFNLIPIVLFFPFCLVNISEDYGTLTGGMYALAIFSLALFNNYLALYIKRLSMVNMPFVFGLLILLFSLAALEYYQVFSIAAVSNLIFQFITAQPAIGIIFPILAIAMFSWNASYLKNHLYVQELSTGEKRKTATDYPFLDRFGDVGTLAAMEIKLILRNKRSKSTVSKGLLFVFYGFLFYNGKRLENDDFGMMLFAGIFMTGNMILLYGQFMFGWQSSEFDGLMANRINLKTFIQSKFLLFTLSSTVLTIVVSLYGLISWKIVMIQLAGYLYSIGVASVLVLYMATRNYKYIDLSSGSSFNWQGVGTTSMLMSLPVLLLPYLIYIPLSHIGNPYLGIAGVAALGLAGIFTRSFWVDFLVKALKKRKYNIAQGFRER
ncbi:hypothetical protein IWX76_001707 [Pedobacter sp. CAN_A7]|uniref:DUF5687 family protein n=1 Tax=Pedobacter sp. CAN_A7 TaxID=2787722 RepID=UPI0018C94FD6